MAAVYKEEVYTMDQVINILGLYRNEAYRMLNEGTFPFPAIQLGPKTWRIPKKPVDDFLAGNLPRDYKPPWKKGRYGRTPKWRKGEKVNYNVPIPLTMHQQFTEVCERENKKMISPITKGDWIRLALQEFIDRRPPTQP